MKAQLRDRTIKNQQHRPSVKTTAKKPTVKKVQSFVEGLRMAFDDDQRIGANDIPGLRKLAKQSGSKEARSLVAVLAQSARTAIVQPKPYNRRVSSAYIKSVTRFVPGPGAGWNAQNTDVVKGRPTGAGRFAGATDVLSLGRGGVVEFELGRAVGHGITIYGNGFEGLDGGRAADPARLECYDPVRRRWVELGVIADSPVMIAPGNGILPSTQASGGDRFLFADAGIAPNTSIKKFRVTDLGQGPAVGGTAGFDLAGGHGF